MKENICAGHSSSCSDQKNLQWRAEMSHMIVDKHVLRQRLMSVQLWVRSFAFITTLPHVSIVWVYYFHLFPHVSIVWIYYFSSYSFVIFSLISGSMIFPFFFHSFFYLIVQNFCSVAFVPSVWLISVPCLNTTSLILVSIFYPQSCILKPHLSPSTSNLHP